MRVASREYARTVRTRLALAVLVVTALLAPSGVLAQSGPASGAPSSGDEPPVTTVAPVPGPTAPPTTTATTAAPPTSAVPADVPAIPPDTGANASPGPGAAPTDTTTPPDVTPPTLDLSVSHPNFSPNGDRVREKAFFTLTAAEPIVVDVTIRNASGARKVEQHTFGPGRITLKWGGRIRRADGTMGRARDGAYTVKFVATDAAGNSLVERLTVRVDTVGPTVAWRSITPDPWGATGPVSFNVTTADPSGPIVLQPSAWDREGRLDVGTSVTRQRGPTSIAWRPDHGGSLLLPGNYFGAVRATDDAGNVSTSPLGAFRVDRSVTSVVVRQVDGAGSRVAVTFDDCNDGAAWRSILATLRAHNVRATFFCPGDQVYAHPAEARATVAAGHAIGSHSNGHAQLTHLSYSDIVGRLRIDKTAWWSVARATPTPYFRPPYGSYDSTVVAAAGAEGFRYTVLWDVDPSDYTNPGASAITSRVLGPARPGSIILLHVQGQTAAALPAILSGLRARGLQQSTLPELFHAAGWQ